MTDRLAKSWLNCYLSSLNEIKLNFFADNLFAEVDAQKLPKDEENQNVQYLPHFSLVSRFFLNGVTA